MTFVRVASPHSTLRCLFCHDTVDLETELLACGACGALHHPECLQEASRSPLAHRCCAHACGAELSLRSPAPPLAPQGHLSWLLRLAGFGFLSGFVLTLLPGCEWAGAALSCASLSVALVAGAELVGQPSRQPLGPTLRIPPAASAPRRRRCLLCPDDAQAGGPCCPAHTALVGETISSSPGARGVNPGARYGPGRLNDGGRP